ncbi:hypothetical protein HOLleu_11877 [Holothuria leucospilota]|uniref:Uncharacterized protein n=1 Tax=Holothuria leucospilota TaxID=206669 RepID=A0A9Q1H9R0_HOLLE|nr:hypothetical protein HOLleu_11877 [Holothuria leucospilota]
MPMSNKERQQKWRQKQKENGTYEQVRKKFRESRKKKRSSLSNRELKVVREKERLRQQKYRAKKVEQPIVGTKSPLMSAQTLGKAVQRVSANLPKSPRKRSRVVKALSKKFGTCHHEETSKNGSGGYNKLSDKSVETITNYYCRDDISWQSPNRKDSISIKNGDEKNHTQKRFMLITLKECYALFEKEYPGITVSLSAFCSLRPQHVFLLQDVPHNLCLCRYHENVRLLLECLNKSLSQNIETHFYDFLETIVCDQENEDCMLSKCDVCKDKFDEMYTIAEDESMQHVKWAQWETVEGRATKVMKSGTLLNCLKALKSKLPDFLIHTFVKRKQSAHFEAEKSRANGEHVVLQVDFAENYTAIQQNEIQSAYWSHNQVTLFTACAHLDNKKVKSYVIVSDDLVHGKYAVSTFLDHLIKDIKSVCPTVKSIAFFSDGAASQFKQRFLFDNITHYKELYNIDATWNFFATSHGKGAVDGIGGNVKRQVWMASKAGAIVTDAMSFADVASKRAKAIQIIYVPAREVADAKSMLEARWQDVTAVPNTQGTHMVQALGKHVVRTSMYSTRGIYHEHNLKDDVNLQASSSSNSTSSCPEEEHHPIHIGDFVLLKYTAKNKSFKYVAQVTDIHSHENGKTYDVTHLRKNDEEGMIFAEKDLTDKLGVVDRTLTNHESVAGCIHG